MHQNDFPIHTKLKINNNNPEITVYDKTNNRIYLIEIGITSLDNLRAYEYEKLHKYQILAKEMRGAEHMPVKIIPHVITWNGVVTD